MANIRHDAVLSAAWILPRRATEAGSGTRRIYTSSQVAENTQDHQAYTKEAVGKLIAAYLDTPTTSLPNSPAGNSSGFHTSKETHTWPRS
jgi:hypothetical protein